VAGLTLQPEQKEVAMTRTAASGDTDLDRLIRHGVTRRMDGSFQLAGRV
jgi:hypothetical protein